MSRNPKSGGETLQEGLRGGLIPAVPVPMTAGREIHRDAQAAYVAYMASQDVAGVAVWAHTGRGLHLSRKQRMEVLASWRRGMPDKAIVAGAGALPGDETGAGLVERLMRESRRMAEDAREGGADALLAYAPVGLKGLPNAEERMVEYHQGLLEAGLPLILFYLYEEAGGVSYSLPLLERLLKLPGVIGIKVATLDSVMTFQDIARLIRDKAPEQLLITGEDRFLGYTVMRGAESALIGMGAACVKVQADLLRTYRQGDSARFLTLSNEVDAFAEVTFIPPMEMYIQRMLWALEALGVISRDAVHDPMQPPVPEEEIRRIKDVVSDLKSKGLL